MDISHSYLGGYPGRTRTSNERIKISSVAITLPGNMCKENLQPFFYQKPILPASPEELLLCQLMLRF